MTAQPRRADFGPRVVLARGERVESQAPDLDRPHVRDAVVRVARAYWLPLEMHQRGTLSRDLLAVAVRYRDDCEIAEGARDAPGQAAEVRVDGASPRCPSQVALDAQARVRRAEAALQAWGVRAVRAAVAGNAKRAELAAVIGLAEAVAVGYLIAQLELIAEAYGG